MKLVTFNINGIRARLPRLLEYLAREQSAGRSTAWIIAIALLGNPATCAYALLAAIRSNGDWQKFWMGNRAIQK